MKNLLTSLRAARPVVIARLTLAFLAIGLGVQSALHAVQTLPLALKYGSVNLEATLYGLAFLSSCCAVAGVGLLLRIKSEDECLKAARS